MYQVEQEADTEQLRTRLADAEDALAALRSGAADALLGDASVHYMGGAEKTYAAFFAAMNEGGVTLDGAGTILYCNPRFATMMGRPIDELRGQSLLSCVSGRDRLRLATLLARQGADTCEVALDAGRAGGWPVQLSLTPLDAGALGFACLVVTDLTKRMQAERELERLVEERAGKLRLAASVFENTLEGVMVTDTDGVILSVNRAFTEITGYSPAEAIGGRPNLLRSQHHDAEFFRGFWQALRSEGRWRGEIWNRRKSGEAFLQRCTINLVPAQRGQAACYVAVITDVTEFWRKDERIAHLAYHDPLTDLPNRTLLLDRLSHATTVAAREGELLGVLFIDLDGFKAVNDQLGHHVGDQLLQEMAARLRACVRSSDTVARLGGDEFVVLMEKLDNREECAVLAKKLLKALSWVSPARGQQVRTGASVGIAVYPEDGTDAGNLLRRADAALYAAKAAGKGCFRYFDSSA